MAICCGSGINPSSRIPFFRRAMDAERQRLIEAFPSYECLQQWDALHAMLIYENLELRESICGEIETWKLSRLKGLRSPFLLKMTKCYSRAYPEIRNPDINVFSDPRSVSTSSATSWERWVKTEIARRMIFLANMLNFYSNRDPRTGKQSSYYEPLDDDMILNMPLPCSQAAWLARNEEDWKSAMQSSPSSGFNSSESEIISSEASLKAILSKLPTNNFPVESVKTAGFTNSDELRGLIILCAHEQFS